MKKRNLMLIVSLVAMLVLGIALMFVGYAISGADIVAWLGSKYAITIYIVAGVFAVVILLLWLKDRNKRL